MASCQVMGPAATTLNIAPRTVALRLGAHQNYPPAPAP
jgi:hypothetical protein